jgi:ubiquinone/menaquinone biosynthesis C-methylase UbiE
VIEALQLRPGLDVAEIGTGHFTTAIARAVGATGHVFAVTAHEERRLPSGCCDRVLMANMWPESGHPLTELAEAARLLREHGRLVVIEAGVPFREVIRALEHNCWDVHRHGDAGKDHYFVEAGVTDESVQS